MKRFLSIPIMVSAVTACAVQPLTPTPVADRIAPPVAAEGLHSAATRLVTVIPAPSRAATPTVTGGSETRPYTPIAASPIPESLPNPTEPPLAAPVVVPPPLPTGVSAIPPTAIPLPTNIAQHPVGTAMPPVSVAPLLPEDIAAAEQYTIDLLNAERAAAGVAPLQRDETLMSIARARVADMVARGYTGHTDPVTGEHLAHAMMRAAGYTSNYLGENWYGSIQAPPGLVEAAMRWFMTDPPHARNILSPNYVWVGVGIAFNGQMWLLVQNFAGLNE